MRLLVAEFAGREIGCAGVALLLGCSLSAARNYVAELLDAGVIALRPNRQAAGGVDRTLYRLAAEPLKVHQFLAALTDRERIDRLWRDADFCCETDGSFVRRDPLVAALFGAAVQPGPLT
ncbi:MAG: hypothetical protein QFF03_15025 [Pseudomonadota bacterium]|nr:hypothetical protein [Pseudomonadota bacterium]